MNQVLGDEARAEQKTARTVLSKQTTFTFPAVTTLFGAIECTCHAEMNWAQNTWIQRVATSRTQAQAAPRGHHWAVRVKSARRSLAEAVDGVGVADQHARRQHGRERDELRLGTARGVSSCVVLFTLCSVGELQGVFYETIVTTKKKRTRRSRAFAIEK